METYQLPDRGDQDNVHQLEDKKLKKRTVVNIDIANDSVASADYKSDEDPKTFKSEKTGRGLLSGDWKVSGWKNCDDRKTKPKLPFIIPSEKCGACDDGLQAGNHPVQVVGAARPRGELHSLDGEEDFHELP